MKTQFRLGCLLCLVTALALISTPLQANPYQYNDTLIADTLNEGERDKQFGIRVAIDGDLAVAASLPTALQPGRIHTFERVNGVWVRRPEQGIDIYGNAPTITLDMQDGFLIVGSNLLIPDTGIVGNARIYRREPAGWTLERSSGTTGQMLDVAIDGQFAVTSQGDQQNGFVFALRRTGGNPLWSSTSLSPIIDQDDNGFGSAVDIEQGAVVVGAPYEDVIGTNNVQRAGAGAAYVFILNQNTWSQEARLVEPDADLGSNKNFGRAVAISSSNAGPDRLLVSSRIATNDQSGRVRGYTRSNGVWTARTAVLSTESPGSGDQFGCALDLDGSWAVVGACQSSVQGNAHGAVTILRYSTGFTSLVSATLRSDSLADDPISLGASIAIDRAGPTVLLGNPQAEVYGSRNEGVVLVGTSSDGTTAPTPVRTLDLGQGLRSALYGYSAADGNTLVVSAFGESIGAQQGRGAAYVYGRENSNSPYLLHTKLLAPDGATGDSFGRALVLVGDTLVITAPERNAQGNAAVGAAYAFRRNGSVWNFEAQLLPPNLPFNTQFGRGIAFDGSTAVIGGLSDECWIFNRSSNGTWSLNQTIAHGCETPQLQGDRLLLNYFFASGPNAQNIGRVSTFVRSAGQWQQQGTSLTGNQAEQRFGYSIASDSPLLAAVSVGGVPTQLYRANGNGWIPETTLIPSDAGASCYSTEVLGNRVFLGCTLPGSVYAVYLFEPRNGNWTEIQKILNPLGGMGSVFGGQVNAHADGSLWISALSQDFEFENQGALFRFQEPPLLRDGFE